jgi:hypothetical protein
MQFFRVVIKVTTASGADVMLAGADTYLCPRASGRDAEAAKQQALRSAARNRKLQEVAAQHGGPQALRYEVARVLRIPFWDWLLWTDPGWILRDRSEGPLEF